MAVLGPVATSLPEHRMAQRKLRAVAEAALPDTPGKGAALDLFDHSRIEARALAMPVPWYLEPHGFKDRNEAYLRVGMGLVEQAARGALEEAAVAPGRVGAVLLVSTTGLATPSLDARLAGRLGLDPAVARLPVWGLGCAGGVAGLNRAAELAEARAAPVLVVALELCSLSFDAQRALAPSGGGDGKKALVAASLFSDGCAAVVVSPGADGLRHAAGASHLFPDSERVMGWDVEDHNLDVVLSPRIPDIVRDGMAGVVGPFLARHHGGRRPDAWVLHPGGAKVVDAYRDALGLSHDDLAVTEAVLRQHGNMSSPTVLFCLKEAVRTGRLGPGRTGLLAALGPGFASELALVQA